MKNKLLLFLAILLALGGSLFAQSPLTVESTFNGITQHWTSGTAVNRGQIVKLNSSGQAIPMATTDTAGVLGVAVTSVNASGFDVLVSLGGSPLIQTDGACNIGDFVLISSSTAGLGHCSSSVSGQVVGTAIQKLSTNGFINVQLSPLSSSAGGGGGGSQAVVLISQNCTGSTAPCIQAPASGGCFGGAVTNSGSNVVTFTSGFPSGIQVGMEAWVQVENLAPNPCPSSGWVQNYTQANYCGSPSTVSPPITVTAVNPGVSVTLSSNSNCPTQNGTNSWIYYGFNLRPAFQAACNTPVNSGNVYVRVGAGFWVLDNVGQSPAGAPICGQNTSGIVAPSPAGIEGDSFDTTYFMVPPWYNHVGDTGTLFATNFTPHQILKNFTLDLTYTNLALPHGTPFSGACFIVDSVRLTGINFGPVSNAEILYSNSGCTQTNGIPGSVRNSFIATGQRAFSFQGPTNYFASLNNTVHCNSNCFLANANGTLNSVIHIEGGLYHSLGSTQGGISDGSIIGRQGGATGTGDIYEISNSRFCMGGSVPAINDPENAGELRISNSLINTNCASYSDGGALGANAGGITIASGVTAYISNTKITANGTGNTINNAGVMYLDAATVQNLSGGAGVVNTGTIHHPESGTCVFAAATTCAVTFSVPFGANPSFTITPVNPGAVTFTVTALSGTAATITASSSNSLSVGWSANL